MGLNGSRGSLGLNGIISFLTMPGIEQDVCLPKSG